VGRTLKDGSDVFYVLRFPGSHGRGDIRTCSAILGPCNCTGLGDSEQVFQAAEQNYVVEEAILQLVEKLLDLVIALVRRIVKRHDNLLQSEWGIDTLGLPVDGKGRRLAQKEGS
jgi:hypothetical protein